LLGSAIKLLYPLYRFARLDSESGGASRALRLKNALGLTYCCRCLALSSLHRPLIPRYPLISTPGHNP
jgi:hypothetical protein